MVRLWAMRGATVSSFAVLGISIAAGLATQAQAFHGRHRAVVVAVPPAYVAAGYCPPAVAGPNSFNPVGFGFGGYSYGGYPYYGYYGYLPGPYEGFAAPGLGPMYGMTAYNPYAAAQATGLDASAPGAAVGYGPATYCLTPHQYRKYVRRLNRALACGWWCAPLAAPCAYGAMMGTAAFLDGEFADDLDPMNGDAVGFGADTPDATNAERIELPQEEVAVPQAGETESSTPAETSPGPRLDSF